MGCLGRVLGGAHDEGVGYEEPRLHQKASTSDVDVCRWWCVTWEEKLKPESLLVAFLAERKSF